MLLSIDASDADVTGYEPVLAGSARVGFVTSGAYGHHVRLSLALAYLDLAVAAASEPLTVVVVGQSRPAKILSEPPYDPGGGRLRS